MSDFYNDHPISDPLDSSGEVEFGNLHLTGWENSLHTNTSRGFVYINKDANEVAVYSRKRYYESSGTTFDSAHRICSVFSIDPSGSDGDEGILLEANTSGITGSLAYTTGIGYCKAIVSFCDETDIRFYIRQLSTALDSSSQHEGKVRFRMALMESFNMVKEGIKNVVRNKIDRTGKNEVDLTQLKDPGQYRQCHAMLAASMLLRNFGGPAAIDYISYAQQLEDQSMRLLGVIIPQIDVEDDRTIDAEVKTTIRLRRS